jgi:hypothetical protein
MVADLIRRFAVEGGVKPGGFPSGGPVGRVAPIWRRLAPSLALLAPDIYYFDAEAVLSEYGPASDGRLFIPECRRSAEGVSVMFRAVGMHGAIGCCPFGIDSLDPLSPEHDVVVDGFALLRAVARAVAAGGKLTGFVATAEEPTAEVRLGQWTMHVDTRTGGLAAPSYPAYGIAVLLDDDEVLVVGRGFSPVFTHADGGTTGLLRVLELERDGSVRRQLNGDETASGSRVTLHALGAQGSPHSPVPLPQDSTGILQVSLYRF